MFGLELNYRDFLTRLGVLILGNQSNEILLVPHTYASSTDVESDPAACLAVRQNAPPEVRHRIHLVAKEYDQYEIKGVIRGCDFFIGSRMHSCIAALSQGVPTIGVAYSKKFKGVFDSIGVGDWVVDGRSTGTDASLDFVVRGIEKREDMRARLAEKPAQARAVLRESFGRLFSHDNFNVAKGAPPIPKTEY
jgi:polysaccharide pyruvyl transferase WcaK-like protein